MKNKKMEIKSEMLPIEDQDILRPGSIFYHYKNLKLYEVILSLDFFIIWTFSNSNITKN